MPVLKCALGVIQQRGAKVIDPSVVTVGDAEADYLNRHIVKVRATNEASARSVFAAGAATPTQLTTLLATEDNHVYESTAKILQDALTRHMKAAPNARDCVFAVVRANGASAAHHVTLLKLDAVVEAARMQLLEKGGVSFEVLKELLPEPGKLQKALSWPDPRTGSEVIMIDTNVTNAQYFENAYQVRVSPKAPDAEKEFARILHECVPGDRYEAAVAAAAPLSGRLDVVLTTLADDYPELSEPAQAVAQDARPAGTVRENKVAARPVIWRADGVELSVPPERVGGVTIERSGDGWRISVVTSSEPQVGH